MGNVNELMTELADAVRLKSGATGDMSIKQMVTAMAGITVADDIGFTCGTFTASSTGSAKVVTHGLGHKPGAVLFVKRYSYDSSSSYAPASSTSSTYDALVSIVFGEDSGYSYGYNTIRRSSSSSSSITTTRYWSHSSSVPAVVFGEGTASNYYVTNINDTTFTSPKGLISGRSYFWIAFRAPLI